MIVNWWLKLRTNPIALCAILLVIAIACGAGAKATPAAGAPAVAAPAATPVKAPAAIPLTPVAAATPRPAVKLGGQLKAAFFVGEFTNLNPSYVNQALQFALTSNIIAGLTRLDKDLVAQPEVAESWSVSPDGLTWIFKIRKGVKFHNGDEYTSDDLAFSYDNTLDPATKSIHVKGLEGVKRPVVVDRYTAQITTDIPRASMLSKITDGSSGRVLTAVSKRALTELGQSGFTRTPVGAGPFKVKEHVLGERLELEKHTEYWRTGFPRLDAITVFNIPEPATIVAALEAGNVDFIWQTPVALYERVKTLPGIIVDEAPDPGFQYINFNLGHPSKEKRKELIGKDSLPTDDVRVRLAVAKAVDRDDYIRKAYVGRAIPGYGPVPPAQGFFFRDLSQASPQRFNLEEARALMKEAGFEKGFSITLNTFPVHRRPAEVMAEMLKKNLNIDVTLDVIELSVLQPRFNQGKWEWILWGSAGDPDPDDSIDDFFAFDSKFNQMAYRNQKVHDLNLKQKTATDPQQRLKYILELQEELGKDPPGAFTVHFTQIQAYRNFIKDYNHVPGLWEIWPVWLAK